MAHDHKVDARAAFMGLIGGALALLVIIYTIVHLTSKKFDAHSATPASSGAPTTPH